MRVLVTGGTGFIGSHTVAALVEKGHDVRLLVRSPDRIAPALEPLGVQKVDSIVGDVTDPEAVERAMEGCEALLHAAAVYSLDSRAAGRIRETNVRSTDLVLGTAVRLGLDPIVYVSTAGALLPPDGDVLTPDSPVKAPLGTYLRSKAEAERVARRYQEAGAPIVSTYPGFVWGPYDPHFGEASRIAAQILKGRFVMVPAGGLSLVDVRDVAQVHAAAMEAGRGPRRYLATGTYMELKEIVLGLAELTGRRLPTRTAPVRWMLPAARLADLAQRVLPFRLPLNFEGLYIISLEARSDDSRTREELEFAPRDPRETFADTVRSLLEQGHISPKEAGKVAARA
ncbi:MAG: SDR family NAD(P)-dependent oxidoreductase [Dehalococcoidia bacterium]|nr:MAG: SDR family NAD(P)-dependent oxidoreductase [Dehalococcoidia bacterium]